MALAESFLVSADNAHAIHPNYPEKADPSNQPKMNGGIVIKHSANQKYTTDAVSAAIFRSICKKAGIHWTYSPVVDINYNHNNIVDFFKW